MRELLLWHVTDMNIGFARFRDTVVAQTAMVLMNRGGGKFINAVDEQQHNEEPQGCEGDDPYTPEEHAAGNINFWRSSDAAWSAARADADEPKEAAKAAQPPLTTAGGRDAAQIAPAPTPRRSVVIPKSTGGTANVGSARRLGTHQPSVLTKNPERP